MLPEEPVIRGRLLRDARMLVDWSQARLACEVGVSRATIHAVEMGRLKSQCATSLAMVQALERAGVQFIPPIDRFGPGLRYTPGERP